jgi:hypothetical protein
MTVDIQSQPTPSEPRKDETTKEVAAGASLVGAFAGVGVVTLAILGLVGIMPAIFAAICAIALGTALLFEGGSLAQRMAYVHAQEKKEFEPEVAGLGAESLAGLATLVLGILALLGVEQLTLLSTSIVVLGAGMLFGGAAVWRAEIFRFGEHRYTESFAAVAHRAVHAASGVHAMVGIGAIVLGILALLGNSPMTLVLIGMLAAGGAIMLSRAAIGGRFLRGLRLAQR